MSNWSLTTVAAAHGTSAAIKRSDGSFVIPDVLSGYPGLFEALADWPPIIPVLQACDPDSLAAVPASELASVRFPNKLLCVGANYRDHLAEMGVTDIPEDTQPFFFSIPPTTSIVGDGAEIRIGDDESLQVDWEAELAVVIGVGGRDIEPTNALQHVAGFACFNDVTARGLMRRKDPIAVPFSWDWVSAKGRDTFAPMGAVTPLWQVPDPDELGVRCIVNGEIKQDGNTRNLLVGLADLVAAASVARTLEPGDVIATGTPAGVGHGQGVYLREGDVVVVEIDGLSPLSNTVRVESSVDANVAAQSAA